MREKFQSLNMFGKSIVMSSILAIIVICIGFNILMILVLWFLINMLIMILYGSN